MPFAVLVAFLAFAGKRLLGYLHFFQQDEYDERRYLAWLVRSPAVDRKATAVLLVAGLLDLVRGPWLALPIPAALAVAGLLAIAWVEPNPLKSAKKKLVLTARAKRILTIAAILLVALGLGLALGGVPLLVWILAVQAVPLALVVANLALRPYEAYVQRGFWQEAHDKLLKLKPKIIGITGSFGKTSVKHIVGHVLETQASALITPGSVNTPMGISRIIREKLVAAHRFFICEMGAYGPGSIARLCRLAPPDIGVITAVGAAHYERFKSLDTVAETKFELALAVLGKPDGRMIVAEQVLDFAYAQSVVERHRARVTIVGRSEKADLRVLDIRQTAAGIETDIAWRGGRHTLKAPLFGVHHGVNLALALAVSEALGVATEDSLLSMRTVPQVAHRLQVKRQPNGSVLIDDAYNSNPVGFASGLAVLETLRGAGGRRILVTPGMVELGAAHNEEHRKIGTLAGGSVDVLLPILPERIKTMVGAFTAANREGLVVPCRNFAEAESWMSQNVRSGDVVLIENDLPDLYERKPAF